MSRGAPPPLPGGYTMGEKVFFTGSNRTWDDGDKLVHGQQGKVTGPVTGEKTKDTQVKVRFPGNRSNVVVNLTSVRRLRAAPAADPPHACAPHTRDARPVRAHDSLCRGAPALTARAAVRTAAHCPGA